MSTAVVFLELHGGHQLFTNTISPAPFVRMMPSVSFLKIEVGREMPLGI